MIALCALGATASCSDRAISIEQDGALRSTTVTEGTGILVREGTVVTTHYTVRLPDGTNIIDTRADGSSHTFEIGGGTVVRGMDRLVRGMRVGGIREAEIPPSLHWGSAGYGGVVPPETVLTFRVEIIDARTG